MTITVSTGPWCYGGRHDIQLSYERGGIKSFVDYWLTTSQSFMSAHRQRLTSSVKDSNPSRSSGSPSTALRGHLPPWHSLSLSALCPANGSPMIPAVVIHCTNEVATRGMLSPRLYRMSMMDERVHGKPISMPALVISQKSQSNLSCFNL